MADRASHPTVLVVEDEPLVRTLAADMLDLLGFEAILASNADVALAIMERNSDIRIVFTDINMPGSMDGLELAHVIKARWPSIAVLLVSGRPLDRPSPPGTEFLKKPYSLSALGSSLRRAVH